MTTYLIDTPLEIAIYREGKTQLMDAVLDKYNDEDDHFYPILGQAGFAEGSHKVYESLISLPPLTTKIEVDENELPQSGMHIYTLEGKLLPVQTIRGLTYRLQQPPLEVSNLLD